ncbi:45504_t:CDS:2, partial [Gigaspora margarita]
SSSKTYYNLSKKTQLNSVENEIYNNESTARSKQKFRYSIEYTKKALNYTICANKIDELVN